MTRSLALLSTLFVACCLVGCGGSEGSSMLENEEQSAIEAYEASLAEEEAAMDADFSEE